MGWPQPHSPRTRSSWCVPSFPVRSHLLYPSLLPLHAYLRHYFFASTNCSPHPNTFVSSLVNPSRSHTFVSSLANPSRSAQSFLSSSNIFSVLANHHPRLPSGPSSPFLSSSNIFSVLANHNLRLPSGPSSPTRVSTPGSNPPLSLSAFVQSLSSPALSVPPLSVLMARSAGAPRSPLAANLLAPASFLLSTSAGVPVLNVDAVGQPLTFRSALAGPFRRKWMQATMTNSSSS
jgi:hypothetical protein